MSEGNNPIIVIDGEPVQVQGIIAAEKPQQCDDCGKIAELRPYGPDGSTVCFTCAMKDKREMERQFCKVMGWEDTE